MPSFVSFTASIAELAHGEKLCIQSLNQSQTSLFDAPGTKVLVLRNITKVFQNTHSIKWQNTVLNSLWWIGGTISMASDLQSRDL